MHTKYGAALLVACLLAVALAPAAAGGTQQSVTIESVEYGGEAVSTTPDRGLHLWQSDSHTFSVRVQADDRIANASVCLLTNESSGVADMRDLACEPASLSIDDVQTVTVRVDPWPADLIGTRAVRTVVRNSTTNRTLDRRSLVVTVLDRDGDKDGDSLSNEAEATHGTDLDSMDTDGDGLTDAFEVRSSDTAATEPDTDADGLSDGAEVHTYHTDPTEPDTDGDGLSDGREVEVDTIPTRADTDGDGLDDGPERNRYQTNATDVDTDGDGLGDGAEVDEYETNPTEPDTDGDGLTDGEEATLHGTDPTRADTDGDGLADATEVTEYFTDPTSSDTDGDGLDDESEIRDHDSDPLAADTDSDGVTDGTEVDLGSDPTDPADTADPGLIRTAITLVTERPAPTGVAVLLGGVITVVALSRRYDGRLSVDPVHRALTGPWTFERTENSERETVTQASTSDEAREPDERAGPTASSDPAIMTNEERVAQLLDDNEGRMLQSDMVDAADWSKATVSRVLSEMEESGAVTRVDIGKGNLVARPGDEPANANSPFSE